MACLPVHPERGVDSTRDKNSRTGMDESKSPVKSVKHSQPRGPKAVSSEKSNKGAPAQREGTKSATRSNENLTAAKDEHNIGGQGSRVPGMTFTEIPQDKRRGRPSRLTRLTGRTSSGERAKGKVASSQQKLVAQDPDTRVSISADSSPSANRETNSPVVPGTPEKGLTELHCSSIVVQAKAKSHGEFAQCFFPEMSSPPNVSLVNCIVVVGVKGVKAASLMHRPIEEVRPTGVERPLTEQQLGLRQAEERLYRDYIHRLLKVRKQSSHA